MAAAAMEQLAEQVLAGDVAAVARACRLVDDEHPARRELLTRLSAHAKGAWLLGVTGSPGAGKSTLVDRVVQHLRARSDRVGVLAVDPTSPFSGGAILGDRIRLQRHFEDEEVFIRSVATRGALGGLSRSTLDMSRVLSAWGAQVVLIETVGVGQDEIDVMHAAHTTLVVVAPGLGDDIQAIKAGILECADVLAVNKADRPGAEATQRDLEGMIALGQPLLAPKAAGHLAAGRLSGGNAEAGDAAWVPEVLCSVATTDEGVADVLERLQAHKRWLETTKAGQERRRRRLERLLAATFREAVAAHAAARVEQELAELVARIEAGEIDFYAALSKLEAQWIKPEGSG